MNIFILWIGLVHASPLPNPAIDFRSLARSVGAFTDAKECRYSEADLVKIENALPKNASAVDNAVLQAHWACLMLQDNLDRDERSGCMPSAQAVFDQPLSREHTIEGNLTYVGIAPLPYAYDLTQDEQGIFHVWVRIHFTGEALADALSLSILKYNLGKAERIWSESSPNKAVRFHFQRVLTAESAHFEIQIEKGSSRSSYMVWKTDWTSNSVAHELGHMMGLDDEYNQIRVTLDSLRKQAVDMNLLRSTRQCNLGSLMCDDSAGGGSPRLYHYYLILRRRFCHTRPYEWPRVL